MIFTVVRHMPAPEVVKSHRDRVRQVLSDNPSAGQLVDMRGIRFTADMDLLRSMVADDPFPPEARRAAVVSDEVSYGITRQYGAMLPHDEQGHLHPFRSLEEACVWLDVPVEVAKRALGES